MKRLRILYVAYPLLPVSAVSAGGAEQMLVTLEEAIAARGHSTVVAACSGSKIRGELFSTVAPPASGDPFGPHDDEHNRRVLQFIARERAAGRPFDLIHDEGGSFWRLASKISEPVLLTAHLAREYYGRELAQAPGNVAVNCVSASQRRAFAGVNLRATVGNGIDLERFTFQPRKERYVLWLGRICLEKAPHLAITAAQYAGVPLVLAGEIYPLAYHREFYEQVVRPGIGGSVQLVERPSLEHKLQLLQHASAVLIPSLVDETSSLVAMEAAACGTPVIAFGRGALPELIVEGLTGFLGDTWEEMAEQITRVPALDPAACRRRAEQRFDSRRMADQYEALYASIVEPAAAPYWLGEERLFEPAASD
jgi:glycosyltransferase involved in cell wall biosynthesis